MIEKVAECGDPTPADFDIWLATVTPKDKDISIDPKDVYHVKLTEIIAKPTDEVPFDANYDSNTSSRIGASSSVEASSRVRIDSLTPE